MPESTDGGMIQVDVLNSTMSYVRQHHCDAADFIGQDISWAKAGHTVLPGHTENVYGGDGWRVTVGRPIIPKIFYEVRAERKAQGITWIGKIENGAITETSYAIAK